MPDRVRVLIVEDEHVVAERLRAALAAEPDLDMIAVIGDVADALASMDETLPDVVVVDEGLADPDGTQAVAVLLQSRPGVVVILLAADTTSEVMARALEAGIAGFVARSDPAPIVVDAIRAAATGEAVFDPNRLAAVAGYLPLVAAPGLSAREIEILQLLADGHSTADIVEQLYLSLHTVRNHIRNASTKLDAHSRLEAVAKASRLGLVSLQPTL